MAAFSRGWALKAAFSTTPFNAPLCRPCLIRTTTQHLRPFTPSLTHRFGRRPVPSTPKKSASKNAQQEPQTPPSRNPPVSNPTNKATPTSPTTKPFQSTPTISSRPVHHDSAAFFARLNLNPTLITAQSLGPRVPPGGELLLYRAPPQNTYVAAALLSGLVLFGMCASTLSIRELGGDLKPWYVLLANGILVVFEGLGGVWMIAGAARLCKRIIAIPIPKGTTPRGGMRVRVEGTQYWPWKIHSVEADIADLSLYKSMAESISAVGPKSAPRAQLPISGVSVFIRPFVRLGRGTSALFKEALHAFHRQSLPTLRVAQKGKGIRMFKVDVRGEAFGGAKGKLSRFTGAKLYRLGENLLI
jgi:hypothetical protein